MNTKVNNKKTPKIKRYEWEKQMFKKMLRELCKDEKINEVLSKRKEYYKKIKKKDLCDCFFPFCLERIEFVKDKYQYLISQQAKKLAQTDSAGAEQMKETFNSCSFIYSNNGFVFLSGLIEFTRLLKYTIRKDEKEAVLEDILDFIAMTYRLMQLYEHDERNVQKYLPLKKIA